MTNKPRIAITLGDPAGIGPEIVLKALGHQELLEACEVTIVGSKAVLEKQAQQFGLEAALKSSAATVLDCGDLAPGTFAMGKVSKVCGLASYDYLARACELGRAEQIDAIVTAPVHKEAWRAAKVPYIGHTEALSGFLDAKSETLFVTGDLRIFFLTRHLSLTEAIQSLSAERLLELLRHANEALQWLGIAKPRIAVAALNPHAGDGGLFGDEEPRVLAPGVEAAKKEEILAFGPLPADSVFHQCAEGQYDAVISLFHDQGHIAAKMKSFHGTVSVTTGLPILRTSVDHGTAFDIAGLNKANPESMVEALRLATKIVQGRDR